MIILSWLGIYTSFLLELIVYLAFMNVFILFSQFYQFFYLSYFFHDKILSIHVLRNKSQVSTTAWSTMTCDQMLSYIHGGFRCISGLRLELAIPVTGTQCLHWACCWFYCFVSVLLFYQETPFDFSFILQCTPQTKLNKKESHSRNSNIQSRKFTENYRIPFRTIYIPINIYMISFAYYRNNLDGCVYSHECPVPVGKIGFSQNLDMTPFTWLLKTLPGKVRVVLATALLYFCIYSTIIYVPVNYDSKFLLTRKFYKIKIE